MAASTYMAVLAVLISVISAGMSTDLLAMEVENFAIIAAAMAVTLALTLFLTKEKKVYVIMEGIETAVPQYKFSQEQGSQIAYDLDRYSSKNSQLLGRDKSFYDRLYKASTVRTRYTMLEDFCLPEEERQKYTGNGWASCPFEERNDIYMECCRKILPPACMKILEKHGKTTADVGKIVVSSSTGFYAPTLCTVLIDELNLDTNISQTNIALQGCAGQGPAFGVANDWCKQNPGKSCLMICVDLVSLFWGSQEKITDAIGFAIFGDGAGIALVTGTTTPPKSGQWTIEDQQTHLIPESRDGILLWYGKGGFCALAKDLPKQVEASVKVSVPPVLAKNGTSVEDLDFWIVHPGGPKIILAVEGAFGLDRGVKTKHSWGVLRDYGNMISASTLFITKRTMEEAEKTGKKGKAMLIAFAPGVTTEFVMFERH